MSGMYRATRGAVCGRFRPAGNAGRERRAREPRRVSQRSTMMIGSSGWLPALLMVYE
jgi:hypothetical protein